MLAALSGLALGAAVTGASSALTAMPLAVIVALGASGALLALVQAPHRWTAAALLAGGLAIGITLPRNAPHVRSEVVTHLVSGTQRGDLFELLERLDADPRAVLGTRVTVSGEWSPPSQNRAATISRRIMTCCAADAVRVGFDVTVSPARSLAADTPVRVTGILRARLHDGELRYVIQDAAVETAR